MAEAPTPLAELALQLRKLFTTYIDAGFSEYQACLIVGTFLAQSGRGGRETHE